jgi:hypothetical protein
MEIQKQSLMHSMPHSCPLLQIVICLLDKDAITWNESLVDKRCDFLLQLLERRQQVTKKLNWEFLVMVQCNLGRLGSNFWWRDWRRMVERNGVSHMPTKVWTSWATLIHQAMIDHIGNKEIPTNFQLFNSPNVPKSLIKKTERIVINGFFNFRLEF